MLYAGETWPVLAEDVRRLTTNDNSMIRWMLGKRICNRITEKHQALGILDVETSLRRERLRWFGHLGRQAPDAWPNAIQTFVVPGNAPRGRPCKRWSDCVKADLAACKLKKEDAKDRNLWRATIRKTGYDERVQPPSTGNKRR